MRCLARSDHRELRAAIQFLSAETLCTWRFAGVFPHLFLWYCMISSPGYVHVTDRFHTDVQVYYQRNVSVFFSEMFQSVCPGTIPGNCLCLRCPPSTTCACFYWLAAVQASTKNNVEEASLVPSCCYCVFQSVLSFLFCRCGHGWDVCLDSF